MELRFIAGKRRKKYEVLKDGTLLYNCYFEEKKDRKYITDSNNTVIGEVTCDLPYTSFFRKMNHFNICYYDARIPIKFTAFPSPKYTAYFKNSNYVAIEHWGTKVSIFCNELQVGYFIKGRTLYKSENWDMKIVANSNEDSAFLTLFCLHIYSNFIDEEPDGNNPAFNISLFPKRFDRKWRPDE